MNRESEKPVSKTNENSIQGQCGDPDASTTAEADHSPLLGKAPMGIGDMSLYVPAQKIALNLILEERSRGDEAMARRLKRAIENTGQVSFRFPAVWEDPATLAANAADPLFRRDESLAGSLRYIAVGSESSVDHSKPIAAYVQGMLQRAGLGVGHSLTTLETKHACAGGTGALLSTAALLGFSGNPADRALTICTDISRYEAPSTAEITQGSGAVAMVVERNPRLLELDMDQHGYYAADKDDFFRPLGSVTARVKGRYSMECYQEALIRAFEDYCSRRGGTPCELVDETDYVAFHVPFVRMPESALRKLLSDTCGKTPEQVEEFISRTRFLDVMDFNREAGNLYTGSLYAYLMSLLDEEYRRIGNEICGKRILVSSYGSGNTMIVFSATIADRAPEVISGWDLKKVRDKARWADFSSYEEWLKRPTDLREWADRIEESSVPSGLYHLRGFDDNGFRRYERS